MVKKKGEQYQCDECGLVMIVESPCECDTCELICCDQPMKKSKESSKNSSSKSSQKKK